MYDSTQQQQIANRLTMMSTRLVASRLVSARPCLSSSSLRPNNLTSKTATIRVAAMKQQTRKMGGGGHYLEVSEKHTMWGEVFGVACWLWIFHRARHDLPVVLGMRHAWEHEGGHDDHGHDSHDDHGSHGHADSRHEKWDKFSVKAMQQIENDDDDDEEEEEDEEEDDEE